MAAAPFVFVRGNHESCARAGPGWLRLLGPLAFDADAPCGHLAPYAVPLGPMTLVVMDDAGAPDKIIDHNLIDTYRADFAKLDTLASGPVWLAMHRPIWGAVTLYGFTLGGNRTLIAALDPHRLKPVTLMLSGHIHAFEALNYRGAVPPQLIAGNSGDRLDSAPSDLSGVNLSGRMVESGISLPGFGFLVLTKTAEGWQVGVHRVDGSLERLCLFAKGRIACPEK
jgi:hypothetical protein